MKWEEARKIYSEKWILFEAIEAHSEKHKKDKSREMYVYSTKNKELLIEERTWIGVRKNG